MKLTAQMKQAWMNSCASRLLPELTENTFAEYQALIDAAYQTWYDKNIRPFEALSVLDIIPTKRQIHTNLTYKGEQLDPLRIVTYSKQHEGRGYFSGYATAYCSGSTTKVSTKRPEGKNEYYYKFDGDNRWGPDHSLELTPEQYATYTAMVEEQEAKNATLTTLIETTFDAIDSTTTDGILKEKYPAIYANMPDYVRNILNADIEAKGKARRERERAKARKVLEMADGDTEAPAIELSPAELAYQDAELALQKAAFLNQI